MPLRKIIGILFLVLAGGLLWWGYDVHNSLSDSLVRAVKGGVSDKAMILFASGGASIIVGLFLLAGKKR